MDFVGAAAYVHYYTCNFKVELNLAGESFRSAKEKLHFTFLAKNKEIDLLITNEKIKAAKGHLLQAFHREL